MTSKALLKVILVRKPENGSAMTARAAGNCFNRCSSEALHDLNALMAQNGFIEPWLKIGSTRDKTAPNAIHLRMIIKWLVHLRTALRHLSGPILLKKRSAAKIRGNTKLIYYAVLCK